MLRDFRETLYRELQIPELRHEFVKACYDEQGFDGIVSALRHIEAAEHYAETGEITRRKTTTRRVVRRPATRRSLTTFRHRLNRLGFDFGLIEAAETNRS